MTLTWCATTALKESFKLFQIHSYTDTSWDDDRNSRKSTCCSYIMSFHMQSLMSSDGLLWFQLQQPIVSVPVLPRKKSSVQMDIVCRSWFIFFGNVSTPVVFKMNHSHGGWTLLRQVKTNSLFSRWMFISDRDGIINLHQVSTDIDDNRPMALSWSFFSVLRRLNQHRPCPGFSLYSTCLNDIEHECESRKYDWLMHVGMVVLKTFDDDTLQWTRQQSSLLDKKWWRVPTCCW